MLGLLEGRPVGDGAPGQGVGELQGGVGALACREQLGRPLVVRGHRLVEPEHVGLQAVEPPAFVLQLPLAGEPGLGDGALLGQPGDGRRSGTERRRRRPRTPSSRDAVSRWRAARRRDSWCWISAVSTRMARGSTGAARRWASRDAVQRLLELPGRRRARRAVAARTRHARAHRPGRAPGRPPPGRATAASVALARACAAAAAARRTLRSAARPPSARASRRRPPRRGRAASQSAGAPTPAASCSRLTHSGDHVVVGPAATTEVEASLDQPALDLLEPAGAEQPLQHGVPLGRAGAQEGLEPSLGQHRHLGELGAGHPEQAGDELAGLVEPVGQRDPPVGPVLLDDDVGLDPGGAGATSLGSFPGRGAGEPERPATDAEPQHDDRLRSAASAWSLRRWRAVCRSPGTSP